MTDVQEWQQENAQRAFPFTESSRDVDAADAVPYGLIVDLKVFPETPSDNGMYLWAVTYAPSTDTYTFAFRYLHNEQEAIHASVTRTDGGQSRVGTKVLLENLPAGDTSYCFLTPGPKWDEGAPGSLWVVTDTNSVHVGSQYTRYFSPTGATVDPNVIVPGSHSMRRVFIYEPAGLPPVTSWGMNVLQKLKEGNNISLSLDSDGQTVLVNAIGGAGSGYPDPESGSAILYVNGVMADPSDGSVRLSPQDCLNAVSKPMGIDNTIQMLSDCIPCCGCNKYRAVSAAITRRSSKLKALCDYLSNMIIANAGLYNDAVDKINASRKPICRVRNVRVRESNFTVSVQNICTVPIYAHMAITMTDGSGISWANFSLASADAYAAHASLSPLPPLPATSKDYDNTSPDTPSGVYSVFVSGADPSSGTKSIPPGGYMDLTFNYNTASLGLGASVFDLRDTGMQLHIESNGIYGAQKTYGCKKDSYDVKVIPGPVTSRKSCDGSFVDEVSYKVVEI